MLISCADSARAIDMILNAKKSADDGNLDDAIEYLRDLEIWAADFNEIVWAERQEIIDAEEAAAEARFRGALWGAQHGREGALRMTITDAKRDLLDGWIAQAACYRELDQADLVDLTFELRTALAEGQPVDVPVFIRSKRT